jgi:dihydropteroate synthase
MPVDNLDFTKINLMGVLNVTPDSFSDGGHFVSHDHALEHARQLIDQGADILDIGGESTRPGADEVSVEEEIRRTIPVIQSIRHFSTIPISIDTSKPEVMLAAAEAGASLINDVWALRRDGAMQAAASTGLPVCLMHMKGEPRTMQNNTEYHNVVLEVRHFLQERLNAAMATGIAKEKLLIDPGFGFGKNLQQNLQLLNALPDFKAMGYPLLVGLSRKSMIGLILDKPVEQRLYGSLSAAVIAAILGADIIRVHDVTETRDALDIVLALKSMPQLN